MTGEESSLVKYLRSRYEAISQRKFPRNMILNVAIEFNTTLAMVFPQLEGRKFLWKLRRLKEVPAIDEYLYNKLETILSAYNAIKYPMDPCYTGIEINENMANAVFRIFESFIG